MTWLALLVVGLALGVAGWLLLRMIGQGWRIGRLLSAAPQRSLAEAAAMAGRDEEAYVRIYGRIDSDEEFPGTDDMPLVFRRQRLQRGSTGWLGRLAWETFDDQRVAVEFGLSERGERIDIDLAALGDGLVVVPRLATGVGSDLRASELPDDAPVRLRIEQVSATDHATACGVPRRVGDRTMLGPGLGRPLILTTLAPDEAMRVLGAEHRSRLLLTVVLLVAAAASVIVAVLLLLASLTTTAVAADPTAVAADPTATAGPAVPPGALSITGDTRSDGGGPGLVGSPLVILVGVIGLGLATAGVTLVLVRLRRGPG